jgi:exonuclease III
MTYNVCWEALEAKKGGVNMTLCKVNNINNCKNNIHKIINKRLNNNYDFICLQEINKSQWISLSENMKLDNYNIIIKEIYPAGIITIYKNNYKILKKYSGTLIKSEKDKRPFMILIFDNNTILINLHMPHKLQDTSIEILYNKLKKCKKYTNKNPLLILCGDFNNKNPNNINNFKNLSKLFNTTLMNEPTIINTCCVPLLDNKKYNLSYDHIFISSNAKYNKYETLPDNEKSKYMSDHLPLFAKIEIIKLDIF